MKKKSLPVNMLYAQSGGVTSVINATAWALIDEARRKRGSVGDVYVGSDGIVGVLEENLIDVKRIPESVLARLPYTPAGAFGSCRFKLGTPEKNPGQYERLFAVFVAHQIGYFFYNGGGDSQDTARKIAEYCKGRGHPVRVLGLPKTIDNDLYGTDFSPGYGSVAKYIAVSALEASLDVASMSRTSTRVFILEVMGRHSGWIAAASALAQKRAGDPPHLILFPERPFEAEDFLARVRETVESRGFCVIVTSEGIRDRKGQFISESGIKDAFGHTQLGGVAPVLAQLVGTRLGYKYHWAVSDYLQRAARHLASRTDWEAALAVGRAAVRKALAGSDGVMLTLLRGAGSHPRFRIGEIALEQVANRERPLPPKFIGSGGYGLTPEARRHLLPLIQGEAPLPYTGGIPDYVRELPRRWLRKRLPPFAAR
jgi:6-phosphofructokinase 1